MRVGILAGGRGTRLAEETSTRPKPMVEIGSRPILWHIMSIYAAHDVTDFVIACGYKGEMIKEYFHHYRFHNSDFTISLADGTIDMMSNSVPEWSVALLDTGLDTSTGGRVLRMREALGDQTFMLTYGDGVADIDLGALLDFHRAHGRLATVTAVRPPARFGGLSLDGDFVREFSEKPQTEAGWINGGFFVFEPKVFDYITDDDSVLEGEPLERLADDGELVAFRHTGFWQPMDTLREKEHLESLWNEGEAPWRMWS